MATATQSLISLITFPPLCNLSTLQNLNPAAESHIFNASDKDIHDAVMEAKTAREQSTLSGDHDNNPEPIEPDVTRKEAVTVAMLLRRYTKNINDPLARKLEAVLSAFGQMTLAEEMKGMKDTKLTLYFTPK